MQDRITFVLTIALSGTGRPGSDLERASILLDSMASYIDPCMIESLIIVTRPQDQGELEVFMKACYTHFPYKLIDEHTICPVLATNPDTQNSWPTPNQGWLRQQMLKLGVATHIEGEFYMTLDSDVIFCKNLDIQNLLTNGRSVLNIERLDDYRRIYEPVVAEHEAYVRLIRYKAAADLLGYAIDIESRDFWYGETPVIMSTSISRQLLSHLEKLYGQSWDTLLSSRSTWTEYPLYFLFAEESGSFASRHFTGGSNTLLNLDYSIWWESEKYLDKRTIDNWPLPGPEFSLNSGYAVVVQSYLGHSTSEIRTALSSRGILVASTK